MTTKKLYRSRKERMIWGVAGGLSEYLNVDPTLVRIGFVLLAFAWGASIIAYIVMAMIVPGEPLQPGQGSHAAGDIQPPPGPMIVDPARQREEEIRQEEVHSRRRNVLGFGLVILGGIILLSNLGWWWNWHIFWPIAIIVVGVAILVAGIRRR